LPETGGGGKISLFKPTYGRYKKIQISKINVTYFSSRVHQCFITTPKAMFDDLTITQTREKINENEGKPLDKMSV
jgi:hypothetical protein